MELIRVIPYNETYVKIDTEPAIAKEISQYLRFRPEGYYFSPKYKNRIWDGYIYLFNLRNMTIYKGLIKRIKKFAEIGKYELQIDESLIPKSKHTKEDTIEFINSLKLPKKFDIDRDYQIDYITHAIQNNRALLLSPTGSGKSFIIYCLLRWYELPTLIIVDSLNLLKQMKSDFIDFDIDIDSDIQLIKGGVEKTVSKNIVISTWQTAAKMDKKWLQQFGLVIGDEAHRYKATSLKKIMESMINTKNRFGTTGSLDGIQASKLTIEGLFGPVVRFTTTKELQDQGYLSDHNINIIELQYSEDIKKALRKAKYDEEIRFLIGYKPRNDFIRKLVLSLDGNTVILFGRIKNHAIPFYTDLKNDKNCNSQLYFVSGAVDDEDRETIRKIVNKQKKSITCASMQVFSTGINIPNLHNIVLAHPTKARIKVIQSIGRVIRVADNRQTAKTYDIADNLSIGKHKNYTLKHLLERIKIFTQESYRYKIYRINMK